MTLKKTKPKERTLTIKLPERILKKLQALTEDFGDNNELNIIEALIDKEIREKDFRKSDNKHFKKPVKSKNQRYIAKTIKRGAFRKAITNYKNYT